MNRLELEKMDKRSNFILEDLASTKPFAIVNLAGGIIYANQMLEKIFDLKKGDSIKSFNSEPNLYGFVCEFMESRYSNIYFDMIYINKDNEAEFYSIELDKFFIAETILIIIKFSSLEEKKLLEGRINNLHNALEYGNVAVIIMDNKGYINYSSYAFEGILKKNIEQLYKVHIADILQPYCNERELQFLEHAIHAKKDWIKLLSDLDENGILWYKELRLNPIKRSEGTNNNFVMVANDITSHIQNNRIIKRYAEKQKSIINNISDLLLILKKENNRLLFENANDNFYKVFEIDSQTANSRNLIEFIPVELYDNLSKAVLETTNSADEYKQFKYLHRISGREYFCKTTVTEDKYDKTKLFIISLSDVTEQLKHEEKLREAYQKEMQLNKLKSAFLANMSHEIRTPLNAVVGYSDLLEDEINEKKDNDLKDIVNYLKDGVKRLLDLVDNIMEVSILESGVLEVDLVKINVNSFIKNLLPDFQKRKNEKNIKLYFESDEKDSLILIDEAKLKKIFDMLIDNAYKYNKINGEIHIRITSNNDLVFFEIEDSGVGINEKKIENILRPFEQEEDDGYRRSYEGAGLGLTIAYRLTKLLNGRLDITSQIDKWTILKLTFQKTFR